MKLHTLGVVPVHTLGALILHSGGVVGLHTELQPVNQNPLSTASRQQLSAETN